MDPQLIVVLLAEGLGKFVSQYPIIATILMVVGVARLVNKPLFSFLRTYVQATPTPNDDRVLDKVEASKAYKVLSYILDLTASIKLPAKK